MTSLKSLCAVYDECQGDGCDSGNDIKQIKFVNELALKKIPYIANLSHDIFLECFKSYKNTGSTLTYEKVRIRTDLMNLVSTILNITSFTDFNESDLGQAKSLIIESKKIILDCVNLEHYGEILVEDIAFLFHESIKDIQYGMTNSSLSSREGKNVACDSDSISLLEMGIEDLQVFISNSIDNNDIELISDIKFDLENIIYGLEHRAGQGDIDAIEKLSLYMIFLKQSTSAIDKLDSFSYHLDNVITEIIESSKVSTYEDLDDIFDF